MRSIPRFCSSIILFVSLAPAAAHAEDYCLAGWPYMGSNPDGAIAKCNAQLDQEKKPDVRSKLLVYRAGAYAAKKDLDRAQADFDEAVKLDSNNASAYAYRGSFFRYERKDLERALANYSAAILINPSYPNLSSRGDIYVAMDRLEAATADYDAAIRAEPKNVLLMVGRGNIWRKRGDWTKALADYDRGLMIDPTSASAINARSAAHATLGLGPTLVGSQTNGPPPAETRFTVASSKKVGPYAVVELWNLDGKPHHCAVTITYGEPAWAVGRDASSYALTLASGKWGLDPQKSYSVNLQALQSAEAATARAVDKITLGITIKPEPAFLKAWAASYRVQVKAPRSTIDIDGTGSNLQAIDDCWRSASKATAPDPFAAP